MTKTAGYAGAELAEVLLPRACRRGCCQMETLVLAPGIPEPFRTGPPAPPHPRGPPGSPLISSEESPGNDGLRWWGTTSPKTYLQNR